MNVKHPCVCGHRFGAHVWMYFPYRYACHDCPCREFDNDVSKDAPEQLEFVGG